MEQNKQTTTADPPEQTVSTSELVRPREGRVLAGVSQGLADREVEAVDNGRALGLGLAFLGLLLLLGAVGWWPNTALVLTAGALAFGTAALTDSSKPGPLAALMDPADEGLPLWFDKPADICLLRICKCPGAR